MHRCMRVDVREFTNYRSFLNHHAQAMKAVKAQWSYGGWARHLGLKSTSSLSKVLRGTREPGSLMVEKFVSYFQFNRDEAQHFRDLVHLSKICRDPALVNSFSLGPVRKPNLPVKEVDPLVFQVVANWYFYAVREMVRLEDFVEDPKWMRRRLRFPIRDKKMGSIVDILLRVGLLFRDESGKLNLKERLIDTANDRGNEALKRHHEQMLDNARVSLRSVAVKQREYTSATLCFDSKRLAEAKEKMRAFKKEFMSEFDAEVGDSVFQFQLQFFPLTRGKETQ